MHKKIKKNLLEADLSFGKVSLVQKAIFAKNLALMLKSGLDIIEALEIVRGQATGKFKTVITDIANTIESGNSLSSSLKRHPKVFSELFINTTLAGETAGTLAENLENVADHLTKSNELYTKIKGALVYPIIVIFGAILLGLVLSFAVLPKIIPLFESMKIDLPFTTKLLIYFTHFIQNYRLPLLLAISFGSAGLYWLATREFSRPVTHYLLLKIPIIKNLVINSNLTNFCSTLGTMLKSGLIIDEALAISKDVVSNYYFKQSLDDVHKKILMGVRLSESLEKHSKQFPKMVISMIKVGERSGNLEASLFHLANFYENEVDMTTKTLSTAIEPILLMGIGVVVGVLAISIITPIYKLTGNVAQ
jgi:type IV pilus assembly protein PilC